MRDKHSGMSKERGNFEEYSESTAEVPPISEGTIREFIEAHHTVSNSGNNGIILKFLEEELPSDIRDKIPFDREQNPEGSLSVKALKIYNRGSANAEFSALQKARRIVKENRDPADPLAEVPKAHAYYDMNVSREFQDYLNNNGAMLVDSKVGILVMDYIEGADLATILYREALKRTHEESDPYVMEEIDMMPFNELHHAVAKKLQFATPQGTSHSEGERIHKEERLRNENAERLFKTLEMKGFVLPRAVLDQIKNTTDAFHKNNFYHNDLHERQVILKDGDLTDPHVFIIDYGSSSTGAPGIEIDRKISDDGDILRRLERITKTLEEKQRDKAKSEMSEWNDRIATTSQNLRLEKIYTSLQEALRTRNDGVLETHFTSSISSDNDLDNFLAMLIRTARENHDTRGKIVSFLSLHEHDTKRRPFIIKRIRQAKEAIMENSE